MGGAVRQREYIEGKQRRGPTRGQEEGEEDIMGQPPSHSATQSAISQSRSKRESKIRRSKKDQSPEAKGSQDS